MSEKTINTPLLKQRIGSYHKKFVENVGIIPEKINADHTLLLTRMRVKIKTVLQCFIDTKIISEFNDLSESTIIDKSCVWFELSKINYNKSIYVISNGINIIMRTTQYPDFSGFDLDNSVSIKSIHFDSYDWVDFADKLLVFIHQELYDSKKAHELKIFGGISE